MISYPEQYIEVVTMVPNGAQYAGHHRDDNADHHLLAAKLSSL